MADKNKWLDAGLENMLKNPAYAKSNTTILKNMLPQKMSAVLLDFAKPLLDITDLSDKAAAKSAITVAATVWNYSIINDDNASSSLAIGSPDKKSILTAIENAFHGYIGERIFADLLSRKKSLYPENNRIIGDFDLNWNESGTEVHLSVITT